MSKSTPKGNGDEARFAGPGSGVTVVIVTYASADHICECIDSVLAAQGTIPLKIVVVDNASGDKSAELVRSRFPEVEVIENPRNMGFAYAVNRGASLASGQYLMILNPDTKLTPSSLRDLVEFVEEKGGRCFVTPRTLDQSGAYLPCVRSLPHAANMAQYAVRPFLSPKGLRRQVKRLLDLWEGNEVLDVTLYDGYLVGAAILAPLDLFREVGMFDDRYFLYLEDADLGLRVAKAGCPAYLAPHITVTHYGGQSARRNNSSSLYFIESYHAYIHKNLTGFHRLLLKSALACFVAAGILRALLRGDGRSAGLLLGALKAPGERKKPAGTPGMVIL